MKKILSLLVMAILMSSCLTNKKSIRDYDESMRLVRLHFPEIYQMYCNGAVVITDVYTFERDGKERVGISYRYR